MEYGSVVAAVHGENHLDGVSVRSLQTGRVEYVPCKTLVIAVGMVPERDLIKNLGKQEWLQLCGNCSSIHPIVEGVVQEGRRVGKAACEKLRGSK